MAVDSVIPGTPCAKHSCLYGYSGPSSREHGLQLGDWLEHGGIMIKIIMTSVCGEDLLEVLLRLPSDSIASTSSSALVRSKPIGGNGVNRLNVPLRRSEESGRGHQLNQFNCNKAGATRTEKNKLKDGKERIEAKSMRARASIANC